MFVTYFPRPLALRMDAEEKKERRKNDAGIAAGSRRKLIGLFRTRTLAVTTAQEMIEDRTPS